MNLRSLWEGPPGGVNLEFHNNPEERVNRNKMKKLCLIFLALVVVAGVALADPLPEPLPFASGYNMVTTISM